MLYLTLADILLKVERDLGLQAETFISKPEMVGYVNEAIDECEAEIHSLYEDYFITRDTLTFVQGQEEYDLPVNIYAHKIRRIIFRNGTEIYTMERLRDWKKFEAYSIELVNTSSTRYAWFLVNSVPGSPKILISPPAKVVGAYGTIWHIRNANRLVLDTDICDIPEFVNYIYQYTKVRCYEKEFHPNLPDARQRLVEEKEAMVGTLAQMVPDADNCIEPDLSIYEEMS